MLKDIIDEYGWKKVVLWFSIILIGIPLLYFISSKLNGCKRELPVLSTKTVYIHDTLVVDKYNEVVRTDTVVRWYEKPIYVMREPEVIYTQKVDTVFQLKVDSQKVMLHLEKNGDKVTVIAYDRFGKRLDEIHWNNVGRDFTATSQKGSVALKVKKIYGTGFRFFGDYYLPINNSLRWDSWNKGQFNIGAKSGLTYLDKINVNLFTKYNSEQKDFILGIEGEWFPFR